MTFTEAPARARDRSPHRTAGAGGPYSELFLRRQDLEDIRRSIRESAAEMAGNHEAVLEAATAGRGAMRPPPALAYDRNTGDYRTDRRHGKRAGADYDWFHSLSKAEQSRLRSGGWFAPAGRSTAEDPDEIHQRIPLDQWLAHTRAIDGARALATGRHVSADRYGGQHPGALVAGTPYDVTKIFGPDHRAALAHVREANTARRRDERRDSYRDDPRARFFTDERGRVHPIRSSQPENRPEAGPERHVDPASYEEF